MDTAELEVTLKQRMFSNSDTKTTCNKAYFSFAAHLCEDFLMLCSSYLALQKAIEVMCVVPKRCNDMMNVGRLQGFEVRPLRALHACGKLPNLTRHLIDTQQKPI